MLVYKNIDDLYATESKGLSLLQIVAFDVSWFFELYLF